MDRNSGDKCRLLTMICFTVGVFLIEAIVGCVTNSISLVADSFHMLTDNLAMVISLVALSIASKKWSINTFGWDRAEILGALINALILLTSSFSIIIEAFKRLYEWKPIHEPDLIINVEVMRFIVNIIGLCLFSDHGSDYRYDASHRGKSHIHKPLIKSKSAQNNASATHDENNDHNRISDNHSNNKHPAGQLNMRGVYLHFSTNAMGSIIVITSLIVSLTNWKYHYCMDFALSILLAIIILQSAWPLLYESSLILLQTSPNHIQLDDIRKRLLDIDGVLAIHEFHVWQLTGDKIVASAHIKCNNLLEYMELAKQVKAFFHYEGIHSTTIQPEFVTFEHQNQTPIEDCALDCPRTNSSCQLQTCCGPTKQSHDTSLVNIPYECRKRKTSSFGTTNTTNCSQTDLPVDGNNGKNVQFVTMILLTAGFFLVEIFVGYYSNSISLIADSFHMLTDIIALIISYTALNLKSKKFSKNTFGSARAEILGSLVNALFLIALCFQITLETIKRLILLDPMTKPELVVIVGVLGLILNVIGLFLFRDHGDGHGHGHSHGNKSRGHKQFSKLENAKENVCTTNGNDKEHHIYVPHNNSHKEHSAGRMNMRGVYLHFLADALGSVVVIISALVVQFTEWKFRYYMDPALSIIMVIIIFRSVWPLLQESILILLQCAPDHIQVDSMQERLVEMDGIFGVHEFHVWQLTEESIVASVHIRCTDLFEYKKLAKEVKIFFDNEGIHSTTIQPEIIKAEIPIKDCVLDCPKTSSLECQLKTCCGSIKQGHDTTPPVDTPYLSRKLKSSSDTVNSTISSHTDLTVNRNTSKQVGFIIMIFLTACIFFVEIIVGYATNSMSLVADSFHMLSDILALIISYVAMTMASKKWSKNTFGWARAEVIGSLVNAVFLGALCFTITLEAFKRFIKVEPITNPKLIVVVGVLGLLVNIAGLILFHGQGDGHGHGHSHGGKPHSHKSLMKLENAGGNVHSPDDNDNVHSFYVQQHQTHQENSAEEMNMRGVYLHFLADAIGSVIVVISALVVCLTDWRYRHYMDPVLSVMLVVIIMHAAWPLLHESALLLLQNAPSHIRPDDVRERLLDIDGVLAVQELHVWQLTGDRIVASAHIRCTDSVDYMDLAERIKLFFHDEGIHSTTVQPEFVDAEVRQCTAVEDFSPHSPRTGAPPRQLNACCETTGQACAQTERHEGAGRDAGSAVDTPSPCVWRRRDTTSVTIDAIDCSPRKFGDSLETAV